MKSRATGRFLASGTGRSSDRIPAYGRGRVCEVTDCDTLLSNYNPSAYCSLHEAACSTSTSRRHT